MEENHFSEAMENIPNFWLESFAPSLTSIDSLLSAQDCNFSYNQLPNTVPNHPTQPDFFVVSESPNPQDQTMNSGVVISSDGDKEREKNGSFSMWFKGRHWRKDEDCKLIRLVKKHGDKKWAEIAKEMPGRIGKQCRERWQNHLRPDIKKKLFWTDEEERVIIEAHKKFGNKWAEIAKFIPERSENSIKNHWNVTKRKLKSKRRIKRSEMMDGPVESTVLEEYIENLRSTTTITTTRPPLATGINHDNISYFIVESSTSINEEMMMMNNINVAPFTHVDDEPSMCYDDLMTSETIVDEEISFMKNLFENSGNNFSNAGMETRGTMFDAYQGSRLC